MFQEEAALRLTQITPGASDFRAMSIETQYYSQATPLFTVPRMEFSPVPDVNGLVVDFALHLPDDRAVDDAQGFLAMVSASVQTTGCMAYDLISCYHRPLLTAVHGCASGCISVYKCGRV